MFSRILIVAVCYICNLFDVFRMPSVSEIMYLNNNNNNCFPSPLLELWEVQQICAGDGIVSKVFDTSLNSLHRHKLKYKIDVLSK